MKLVFPIGTKEKHVVDFRWGQLLGTSSIRVDGNVVHRGRPVALDEVETLTVGAYAYLYEMIAKRSIPWQRVRSWDLEVGTAEKHYVRIEKERPQWLAALRPHRYRVLIDGELLLERVGY